MAAVLMDAVEALRRYQRAADSRSRRRLAEVVAWFEETDLSWPFSFTSICTVLDLDAAKIRQTLR